MRWIIRVGVVLATLVVLAVGLGAMVPAERVAQAVSSQFEAMTGRKLQLQGEADLPSGGAWRDDTLAAEVPVALVFNGISHAVMMATPRAASTSQNLSTFLSVPGSSTVFADHTPPPASATGGAGVRIAL